MGNKYYGLNGHLSRMAQLVHRITEKSSSRKPAVPKVATYRILTQLGEYRGWFGGVGAECMRA